MTCFECKWFHHGGSECRRRSPVGTNCDGRAVWPYVGQMGGPCGDFEADKRLKLESGKIERIEPLDSCPVANMTMVDKLNEVIGRLNNE